MHYYAYNNLMKYFWNEAKRLKNLQKHRLDFTDAARIFDGPTLTIPDDRADYGEARFTTMGLLEMAVVVIAHTENESEIRVISMRKAERYETEIFFSCA